MRLDENEKFDFTEDERKISRGDSATNAPITAQTVPIEEPKKENKSVVRKDIDTNEVGLLVPKNLTEHYRLAQYYIAGGMVPKHFKTPEQVIAGMQYAKELGFPALSGLKNIAVINGSPSLWGEHPLALVNRSGLLVDIDEYALNEKYDRIDVESKNLTDPIFAAICYLQRKGREWRKYTFTVKDLERAKLSMDSYGQKKDVWDKWFPIMMKRKVRAIALRDQFPDVLAGIDIAELNHHTGPEINFKTPNDSGKFQDVDLNARFANAKEV